MSIGHSRQGGSALSASGENGVERFVLSGGGGAQTRYKALLILYLETDEYDGLV